MNNSYRLQLIFAALISVLIGLMFILFPTDSLNYINYIIVISLLVLGMVQFIGYFVTSVKDNQFRIGFVTGVICFVLGAYAYFESSTIMSYIPKFLGIAVLLDSLITMQNSIDLYRLGSGRWYYQLILAAITIVLGTVMFFNPFVNHDSFIMFAGVTMIVNGVLDLFNILYLSIKINESESEEDEIEEEPEDILETEKDEDTDEVPEEITYKKFKPISADEPVIKNNEPLEEKETINEVMSETVEDNNEINDEETII